MADESKLVLPGDFEAGKSYLIRGEHMLAWRKALLADRVVAGAGLVESGSPNGRIFKAIAGAGDGATNNAFFRVYQNDGKWWLQGGQVASYESRVSDIELATVGSEPVDGSVHWLEITGNGVVVDGLLFGGFTVTAVDDTTAASPSNTVPTVETHTGRKFHVLLGSWMDEVFTPEAGGNILVGFCGTAYSPTRF